jgi:hypothetical protein
MDGHGVMDMEWIGKERKTEIDRLREQLVGATWNHQDSSTWPDYFFDPYMPFSRQSKIGQQTK